jgi:hypothetical protein
VLPTGLIIKDNVGFGGMSKSLARSPEPFFRVRMKPLGSLGVDGDIVVYGDEATVDFMSALEILWGTTEPAAWDALQDGWQWTWNIRMKKLTITDAKGNVTVRRVTTWSALGVAAAVLESHQFVYYFDGGAFMDAELLAERDKTARPAAACSITWGEFDRYLSAVYHALFLHMRDWLAAIGDAAGTPAEQTYSAIADLRKAITAKIGTLAADGVWTQNMFSGASAILGTPHKETRAAMMAALGKYLMVSLLTASMLQAGKPCYEPWMLWQMFRWLQQSTTFELDDKIFDLSPNWGG